MSLNLDAIVHQRRQRQSGYQYFLQGTLMSKNILRFQLFLVILLAIFCTACATQQSQEGPGMIVTFSNGIKAKKVYIERAMTAKDLPFPSAGFLAPDKNPLTGGKTMGAAPDGRELPEWVEFEWTEWPYPSPEEPKEPVALRAYNDRFDFLMRTIPHKRSRVAVRSRVPQDVVEEVLASKRQRAPHALPDKMLWVYFIWYESGIKFRWSLEQGCCKVLRKGGDELEP